MNIASSPGFPLMGTKNELRRREAWSNSSHVRHFRYTSVTPFEWPGPRIKDRIKVRSGKRPLMRARPLKRSNGSGARDLNSTRLPSVLARFSFPGEGSLGTRLG